MNAGGLPLRRGWVKRLGLNQEVLWQPKVGPYQDFVDWVVGPGAILRGNRRALRDGPWPVVEEEL